MNRRKVIGGGMIAICLVAIILILTTGPARADLAYKVHTTLEDFNAGTLYHTGLTRFDDGEVQLMVVGLSGEWITDTNTVGLPPLSGHTAVYDGNGHIIVLGGQNAADQPTRGVYYTTIQPEDHDLADWQQTASLPSGTYDPGVYLHASVVVNNYVYVIGGGSSLNFALNYNTVSFAEINPDGTLGSWQTTTAPIPKALRSPQAAVVNGRIYVIGGRETTGAPSDTVYFAEPASNGQISSWTLTTPFAHPTWGHMAAVHGGTLYVLGGFHTVEQVSPYVHFAVPNVSTGQIPTWTLTTEMEHNLYEAEAVGFDGILFTTGGAKNTLTSVSNYVGAALIDEQTHDVGAWSDTSLLKPEPGRFLHATVYSGDGWMYVIQGHNGVDQIDSINRGSTLGLGDEYAPEGTFLSEEIDVEGKYPMLAFSWNSTISDTSIMTLTMRYRRKASTGDWSPWFGPYPSSPTPGTVTTTVPLSGTARFFQYEASFATEDTSMSPLLNAVRLAYDIPLCQIEVEKNAVPASGSSVSPGQIISYTLSYFNETTGVTNTNSTLIDMVPEYTTYLTDSIWGPGASISETGVLAWDLGTVNPNSGGVAGFAVVVDDPMPGGFGIDNIANLTSNECSVLSNHTVHTTVIEGPDLVIDEITIVPDCPDPGDAVTYYVTVRNQGTEDATEPFWVEIYVKDQPSNPPVGPSDHDYGYCLDGCTITRTQYVELLPPLAKDETYVAPFDDEGLIYPTGGPFDIYAQVDVAFDGEEYHPDWGSIPEEDESNNIGQAVGCGRPRIYLPVIQRAPSP